MRQHNVDKLLVGELPNLHFGMFGPAVLLAEPNYRQLCPTTIAHAAAMLGPRLSSYIGSPLPPDLCQLTDVPQRTDLWKQLRVGRVTASTVSDLLGVREVQSTLFLRAQGVKLLAQPSPDYLNDAHSRLLARQVPQPTVIHNPQVNHITF